MQKIVKDAPVTGRCQYFKRYYGGMCNMLMSLDNAVIRNGVLLPTGAKIILARFAQALHPLDPQTRNSLVISSQPSLVCC